MQKRRRMQWQRMLATALCSVMLLESSLGTGSNVAPMKTYAAVDATTRANIEASLYNAEYYENANEDVAVALGYDDEAMYNHWINYGKAEGRNASMVFNAKYYLEVNPDVAAVIGENNYVAAYEHFVNSGLLEGRESSPVFSIQYYLQANTDVAAAFNGDYVSAAKHFNENAIAEGRSGSGNFDYTVYRACNTDVEDLYGNYIEGYYIHYINHGRAEGRTGGLAAGGSGNAGTGGGTSGGNTGSGNGGSTGGTVGGNVSIDVNAPSYRIFDAKFYLEKYPALANKVGTDSDTLYKYWISEGISQGQTASPVIVPEEYLALNQDVAAAFGDDHAAAINHFLNAGITEGRTGSKEFDYSIYANCNTDVGGVFVDDIVGYYFHYVKYGKAENRTAAVFVPTATAPPTPSPKPTSTPVPTATPKPTATPTPSPKPTSTPVPTATPKPTATPTPSPTPTNTPVPTATPKPTATPTPSPMPTNTPVPTATPKPTATPTPSPKPTNTPTPTPTNTPTPTPTSAPTTVTVNIGINADQVVENITMAVGESISFKLLGLPDVTIDSWIWESSDESVLTIDGNGNCCAVGNGSALVIAKVTEASGKYKFEVVPVNVTVSGKYESVINEENGMVFVLKLDDAGKVREQRYFTDNMLAGINTVNYDANGVLTGMTVQDASGADIGSITYEYYPNGNLNRIWVRANNGDVYWVKDYVSEDNLSFQSLPQGKKEVLYYSEDGNSIIYNLYNSEGMYEYRTYWTYKNGALVYHATEYFAFDEYGTLIKTEYFDTTTGELAKYETYEYYAVDKWSRVDIFDADGNSLGYITYDYDENGTLKTESHRDESGYLTELYFCDEQGNRNHRQQYQYHENGKEKQVEAYTRRKDNWYLSCVSKSDEEGKTTSSEWWNYDEDANVTRHVKEEYTNGQKTAVKDLDSNGIVIRTELLSYDESGRLVKSDTYEHYDGVDYVVKSVLKFPDKNAETIFYFKKDTENQTSVTISHTENHYDAEGNLLRYEVGVYDENGVQTGKEYCDAEGTLISYTEFEWNETGDGFTEIRSYSASGVLEQTTKYAEDGSYTVADHNADKTVSYLTKYDASGNRFEATEYTYDGNGLKEYTVYSDFRNGFCYLSTRYDKQDNPIDYAINERYENGALKSETIYDMSDKPIQVNYYDAEGNREAYWMYEYSEDGSSELREYDSAGKLKFSRQYENGRYVSMKDFNYDAKGDLVSWGHYLVDENGCNISGTFYDADDNVTGTTEREYDQNGNLKSSKDYNAKGNLVYEMKYKEDGSYTVREMTYDENGIITGRTNYLHDSNGTLYTITEDSFENGRQTGQVQYSPEREKRSSTKYYYNEAGQISKFEFFTADDTLRETEYRYYNENGKVSRTATFDAGDVQTGATEYFYNGLELTGYNVYGPWKNGLHYGAERYNSANKKIGYIVTERNTDGIIDMEYFYDNDDTLTMVASYVGDENGIGIEWTEYYTYDAQGVIVESKRYSSEDVLISVTSYYDDFRTKESYVYDETGTKAVTRINYSYNGEKESTGYTVWPLDENGESTEGIYYDADGDFGWKIRIINAEDGHTEQFYDEADKLYTEHMYSAEGEWIGGYTYVYDNDGRLTKKTTLADFNYTVASYVTYEYAEDSSYTEYFYDAKGNLTGIKKYDTEGNEIVEDSTEITPAENDVELTNASGTVFQLELDESGAMTKQSYYVNEAVAGTNVLTYDESGNLTTITFYNANGVEVGELNFTYTDGERFSGHVIQAVQYAVNYNAAEGTCEFREISAACDVSAFDSQSSGALIVEETANGATIRQTNYYYEEGELTFYIVYHDFRNGENYKAATYDSQGNQTSYTICERYENGALKNEKIYDMNDRLTQINFFAENWERTGGHYYHYNEDGSLNYIEECNGENVCQYKRYYENDVYVSMDAYNYDENGTYTGYTHYIVDENDRNVSGTFYDAQDNPTGSCSMQYDGNGRLKDTCIYDNNKRLIRTENMYYKEDGSKTLMVLNYDEEGTVSGGTNYLYDSEGTLYAITEDSYENGRQTGQVQYSPEMVKKSSTKYYYNENGTRIKAEFYEANDDLRYSEYYYYNADGSRDYTERYDVSGKKTSEYQYEDGVRVLEIVYHYDEEGNPNGYGKHYYNETGSQRINYEEYNASGIIISKLTTTYENGVVTSHVQYKYDETGRVLREFYKDAEWNSLGYTQYDYMGDGSILITRYDADGNQTSQETVMPGDTPTLTPTPTPTLIPTPETINQHYYTGYAEETELILRASYEKLDLQSWYGTCYNYSDGDLIDVPQSSIVIGEGYVQVKDEFLLTLEPAIYELTIYIQAEQGNRETDRTLQVHVAEEAPTSGGSVNRSKATLSQNTNFVTIISSSHSGKFTGVALNESMIDAKYYTLECGAKVMILDYEYLMQFANLGTVTLTYYFDNGNNDSLALTISETPATPTPASTVTVTNLEDGMKFVLEFDEEGVMTGQRYYVDEVLAGINTVNYDANGVLTGMKLHNVADREVGSVNYRYHENGAINTIRVYANDADVYWIMEYVSADNVSFKMLEQGKREYFEYSEDGTLIWHSVETFENGKGVKLECFDTTTGALLQYEEYVFDDRGKTTEVWMYNANDVLRHINYLTYDENGVRILETVRHYDEKGNYAGYGRHEYDETGSHRINYEEYNASGIILSKQTATYEDGVVTAYVNYEYDSGGKLLKQYYYDGGWNLQQYKVWEYDNEGQTTRIVYYDSNRNQTGYNQIVRFEGGHTEKHHNANGVLYIEFSYNAEGCTGGYEYFYDADGVLIKRSILADADNRNIIGWEVYEYDKEGNVIRILEYEADGETLVQYTNYTQSQGQNLLGKVYSSTNDLLQKIDYFYDKEEESYVLNGYTVTTYDNSGAVAGITRYDANGAVKESTEDGFVDNGTVPEADESYAGSVFQGVGFNSQSEVNQYFLSTVLDGLYSEFGFLVDDFSLIHSAEALENEYPEVKSVEILYIRHYLNGYYVRYAVEPYYEIDGDLVYAVRTGDISTFDTEDRDTETYEELFNVAEELGLAEMSQDIDKIKAVHDYLVLNTAYDLEHLEEKNNPDAHYARGNLLDGKAVCSGYASAFRLFMDMYDIECHYVVNNDHAWNVVELDGKWYVMDVTWDDPTPDRPGEVSYDYFLVTEAVIQSETGHEGWRCECGLEQDHGCTNTDYILYPYSDYICTTDEVASAVIEAQKEQETITVIFPTGGSLTKDTILSKVRALETSGTVAYLESTLLDNTYTKLVIYPNYVAPEANALSLRNEIAVYEAN